VLSSLVQVPFLDEQFLLVLLLRKNMTKILLLQQEHNRRVLFRQLVSLLQLLLDDTPMQHFFQNYVVLFIKLCMPFAITTQPIKSLAFSFVKSFMKLLVLVFRFSVVILKIIPIQIFLLRSKQFIGIWYALTKYMFSHMFDGIWRSMGHIIKAYNYQRRTLNSASVHVESNIRKNNMHIC